MTSHLGILKSSDGWKRLFCRAITSKKYSISQLQLRYQGTSEIYDLDGMNDQPGILHCMAAIDL
jgi:hypothetical protein